MRVQPRKSVYQLSVRRKLRCIDGDLYMCRHLNKGKEMLLTADKLLPYAQRGVVDGVFVVNASHGSPFLRVTRGIPVVKTYRTIAEVTGAKKLGTAADVDSGKRVSLIDRKRNALAKMEQTCEMLERGNPYQREDSEIEIGVTATGDFYTVSDYSESRGSAEMLRKLVAVSEVSREDVEKLCDKHGWFQCF